MKADLPKAMKYLEAVPPSWEVTTVGAVASYVGSGVTPLGGSKVYANSGVVFIRSQNVTFGGLLLDDVAYISERTHKSMGRSQIVAHDVLLNITGASIGRCCPFPEWAGPANVNQHVCAIRLPNSNKEDAIFLSSVLSSPIGQMQIDRLNAGGNREGLNYQQLRSFYIPWPRISVRKRIAEILDAADEAIRKAEALIAKLKQMKAGLLHDLLTRGLDENGELRDPARQPEQFKDSPLGKVPADWNVTPMKEVVPSVQYGISCPLDAEDGIPVLRMNNLFEGEVSVADLKFTRHPDAAGLLLKPQDVLFNRTNSMEHVGRTSIWRGQRERISFASYLVRLNPDLDRLSPEYLNLWMNLPETQIRIRQCATPAVQQVNINPTKLRETPIAVPRTIKEQERIYAAKSAHDLRIHSEEIQRDKHKALKQGLMHDLLTGKVRA